MFGLRYNLESADAGVSLRWLIPLLDLRASRSYPVQVYRIGYTVIELMVTILIVTILVSTLGVSFVKLLTIQEKDREQAFIRERLTEICSSYADCLSIGTSVSNTPSGGFVATYRNETGGVSLETGRVDHASLLVSSPNEHVTDEGKRYFTLDLGIYAYEMGIKTPKFLRDLRGDNMPLISPKDLKMKDGIVSLSCAILPLNAVRMEDAALGYLTVTGWYNMEETGALTNVAVGRIVRLWNHE